MNKCQYEGCEKEATRGKVLGNEEGEFIYCDEHAEMAIELGIIA